jgi:hypothetical protein
MNMKMQFAVVALLFSVCCGGNMGTTHSRPPAGGSLDTDSLRRLGARRIFFGHQSVGQNILQGVNEILRTYPQVPLRVVETHDPADLTPGVIAHATLGTNGDPSSKLRAFARSLDSGIGKNVDVALFKYCYVDVNASTDVKNVLEEYKTEMSRLKSRFPAVRFVHVTMPLRKVQEGPKAFVKRLIGKPLGGFADNVRRNEYNELLRAQYLGREPVFDLAELEARRPDGSLIRFAAGDRQYEALNPAYTYDNGHLNEAGRLQAAAAFLQALASE